MERNHSAKCTWLLQLLGWRTENVGQAREEGWAKGPLAMQRGPQGARSSLGVSVGNPLTSSSLTPIFPPLQNRSR